MRIVVHDFGGYPFSAQLARTFASRGHDVTYLYAEGIKRPRAGVAGVGQAMVTFRGITIDQPYRRRAGPRRLAQERRYGRILAEQIARADPDVVVSANCPLDAQRRALDSAHENGAAFVHWCQDVYSLAVTRMLDRRLPGIGRIVGARFERLERHVVRSADAVVVIAGDFLPVLRAWGVPEERLAVIENWAPLDEIQPLPKLNEWAIRHGVHEKFVFLYAGTLGRKHDPSLLVTLADAVAPASVVVASEGVGTDRLWAHSRPENLQLLPLQPHGELAGMLASADVLVAILEEDAGEFSVPSKILTYLAAGRPVLAAMPRTNRAARTIVDARAGVVVDPSDHAAFADAARQLLSDSQRRQVAGLAARTYAERMFDITAIAERFESVLETAVRQAHSRRPPRTDTSER